MPRSASAADLLTAVSRSKRSRRRFLPPSHRFPSFVLLLLSASLFLLSPSCAAAATAAPAYLVYSSSSSSVRGVERRPARLQHAALGASLETIRRGQKTRRRSRRAGGRAGGWAQRGDARLHTRRRPRVVWGKEREKRGEERREKERKRRKVVVKAPQAQLALTPVHLSSLPPSLSLSLSLSAHPTLRAAAARRPARVAGRVLSVVAAARKAKNGRQRQQRGHCL